MPDLTPTDTTPTDTTPTPGTKAALQLELDAARARITALEGELAEATSTSATVAADRDAAVAQLAEAGERIDALQRLAERSRGESTMHDLLGLLERLTRATESQALAALGAAAWQEGKPELTRALSDRALKLLG